MARQGDLTADRVLGQFDFTHNGTNILTNAGLSTPAAVAVDRSVVPNRLYVADMGNHRVLGWHSVDALKNGATADLVIGQQDFLSSIAQCRNAAVNGATLCSPSAIAVDGAGNLYVVDQGNNRVLEYNIPFTTDTLPDLVFGQNGSFTSSGCNLGGSITDATLCNPTGVAVDTAGNVYISDWNNSRILEYDSPLVTDTHADMVFGQGGKFNSGVCNDGGVSAGSLCNPGQLAVDAAGNLYASDSFNWRVLEYNDPLTGNTTADLVFGQGNSFTSNTDNCGTTPSSGNLCTANGIAVDSGENLYISDANFKRILEFNKPVGTGDTSADLAIGTPNLTSLGCNAGLGSATLCGPMGVALDSANNLYMADLYLNRVLQFNDPLATSPPNTTADLVLGQFDFNQHGTNIIKSGGLDLPLSVAVDPSVTPNRLYVADWQNNRVLGWKSAPGFANGAAADIVIGQPDFLSGDCNQTPPTSGAGRNPPAAADTLCNPAGVAVDPQGNLYVADSSNSRVLEYDQPFGSGKITDLDADLVFGQHGSFTTTIPNQGGVSGDSLSSQIFGVGTDPAGNLYVADSGNNRVLEFSAPVILSNTSADAVFGQGNNFSSNTCNFDGGCNSVECFTTADALCNPSGAAVNSAGNIFIADSGNGRVLGYANPLTTDKTANLVLLQKDFKTIGFGGLLGVAFDSAGNLYAAGPDVFEFNAPFANGMSPNVTIPQSAVTCPATPPNANSVCAASAVAVDSGNNLYVADTFNNRVLEFERPIPTVTPTPTLTPSSTPTPKPTRTATSTPRATPTRTPIPTMIPTHTPVPTHTPTPTRTPRSTPTPTPRECMATTPVPTVPVPTPTPLPGHPRITKVQDPVLAGANFTISGSGFTKGSEINFFVSTPTGAINQGPLKISASSTTTQLVVPVPSTIALGQGFVSVVVVNTDAGFVQSNPGFALLQGSAAAGLPSITGIDGHPLAATSLDPDFAVANVETTLLQGSSVVINGTGFDTVHGAAVDVFCACPGGKLPTTFLAHGNPNLKSNSITFTLPLTTPTGPGSIIVSNAAEGSYSAKSNAVSVPLGARINVISESQSGAGSGSTITVNGTGFSTLTVINLFNAHGATVVNLGGLNSKGMPRIQIKLINSTRFTITLPAGAVAGPAFIEALNPPFLAFTSSGNDPCGAFILK